MKKKWRILTYALVSTAIVATVVTLPIVLTYYFQHNSPIKNFFSTFNDPYKELDMFAQSLDAAYNKTNAEFTKKAEVINSSMKSFIKQLKPIVNNKKTYPTILFLKNDSLVFNNNENSKEKVNEFWCEQPMLFPSIYNYETNNDVPGLNFYFPAPINNDANSLFDDWFEIGASSFQSAYNKYNISQRIVTGWANTCDYVFYLYDSNVIQNENAFINYVYNTSNTTLWANKLLKKDALCNHVIPIDMQWFYYGIWDQVGTFIMMYLITNVLLNPTNALKIDLNQWNNVEWNPTIKSIASSCKWTPKKNPLIKLNAPSNSENKNYLATLYNLVGHSFSLGILPDYIMKFNEDNNNKKYNDLAGYLDWFKFNNLFNFKDQNTLSTVSSIRDLKLYAISANRDILGTNAIWPLDKPSLLHDTTPTEIGNIVGDLRIRCIFSERNDTDYTQTLVSDKIVFDTTSNNVFSVQEWVDKNA